VATVSDVQLATGVTPAQFGVRDFSKFAGSALGTWDGHEDALDELGVASERIAVGEAINFERIAGARSDLIIGDDQTAAVRSQLESQRIEPRPVHRRRSRRGEPGGLTAHRPRTMRRQMEAGGPS